MSPIQPVATTSLTRTPDSHLSEDSRPGRASTAPIGLLAAYFTVGLVLVLSRLVALDRSFWHDEILTVVAYVRAGPRDILAGSYIPNNHELFSLAGWATTSLVGESEVGLRLWSAIPFVLGVLVVTVWLHRRLSPVTALLYACLATASPMLLDLSRQARGYGLAFLAMSILVVAGLEAQRGGRSRALAAFFVAGVLGTWTLPVFGLAFVGVAAALAIEASLRRRALVGLTASTVAVAVWYAPHFDDLRTSSGQEDGAPIAWLGLLIAPVDRVLIPGMFWFDKTFVTAYPARAVLVVALAVLILSSPLLRERRTALLLGSGVVATLVTLWATQLYLQPRFVSYLLVPLLILTASGAATIVGLARPTSVRALTAAGIGLLALAAFIGAASHLLRLPGEAWRDAAQAVQGAAPADTPVLAYVWRPLGLSYYLERPVTRLSTDRVVSEVCENDTTIAFVTQPYALPPVAVPCLQREGVRHYEFAQTTRGGEISVWIVPPKGE